MPVLKYDYLDSRFDVSADTDPDFGLLSNKEDDSGYQSDCRATNVGRQISVSRSSVDRDHKSSRRQPSSENAKSLQPPPEFPIRRRKRTPQRRTYHRNDNTSSSSSSSSAWTQEEDARLVRYKSANFTWSAVAEKFPGKTGNACRKRHERFMKSTRPDMDQEKLAELSLTYKEIREAMWTPLGERVGESWNTVEKVCMERGLKPMLGQASRHSRKRSRNNTNAGASSNGSDSDAHIHVRASSSSSVWTYEEDARLVKYKTANIKRLKKEAEGQDSVSRSRVDGDNQGAQHRSSSESLGIPTIEISYHRPSPILSEGLCTGQVLSMPALPVANSASDQRGGPIPNPESLTEPSPLFLRDRKSSQKPNEPSLSLINQESNTLIQGEADQEMEVELADEKGWSPSPDLSSRRSDSEDEYQSTSERSILNYSENNLVQRLMDEVCSSFFFSIHHHGRQAGERVVDSSSCDSIQSPTNRMGINRRNSVDRRKRAWNSAEESEDEDDGKRKQRRSRESAVDEKDVAEARCFACPFHQFDPSTFSNRNENPRLALKYRSCGPPGWSTIGKMKEHLYRTHQTPIHCPRCWATMKTEAALGEHARSSSLCSLLPQPLRWIPREVYTKLKDRKKSFAGQTNGDTWRYIFGLIFPDSVLVPSPYYDEGMTSEDMTGSDSPTVRAIATYELYARAHLPRLVEEALETSIAEQTQPIEDDLRRELASIVRDCHTRLAQTFLQQRSSDVDQARVEIDALPSFYIEPLSLTDESFLLAPDYSNDHEQMIQPLSQADSGYASVQPPSEENSRDSGRGDRLQDDSVVILDGVDHGEATNSPYQGDQTPSFDVLDWSTFLGNDSCDQPWVANRGRKL